MSENISKLKIKCPKCKSKRLLVVELWKDHAIEFISDQSGNIDMSSGNLSEGNPYKVELECKECKHRWSAKNAIQIANILK